MWSTLCSVQLLVTSLHSKIFQIVFSSCCKTVYGFNVIVQDNVNEIGRMTNFRGLQEVLTIWKSSSLEIVFRLIKFEYRLERCWTDTQIEALFAEWNYLNTIYIEVDRAQFSSMLRVLGATTSGLQLLAILMLHNILSKLCRQSSASFREKEMII